MYEQVLKAQKQKLESYDAYQKNFDLEKEEIESRHKLDQNQLQIQLETLQKQLAQKDQKIDKQRQEIIKLKEKQNLVHNEIQEEEES